MQDIIHVVAKFQAQPGKEEALRKIVEPLLEPTRKEAGCLRYALMQDRKNPAVLTLLEEWESNAALKAHMALPHVAQTLNEASALLATPPEIALYKQLG